MDGVHNPSLHANATPVEEGPLAGRFAYLAERGGGRALRFDKFVWNDKDSRRLARSARREGIRPKDGLNPTHPSS